MKILSRIGILVMLCLIALPISSAFAQSDDKGLEETLGDLAESAGKLFVKPVVNGFGVNINGGWFHKSPKAVKRSFDFEFGIVGMGTFFKDADETFSVSTSTTISRETAIDYLDENNVTDTAIRDALLEDLLGRDITVTMSGPTAIGSSDNNIRIAIPGQDIVLGGGLPDQSLDGQTIELEGVTGLGITETFSFMPTGTPQFSFGTLWGTNATFRYVPSIEIDDEIGKISYFGFGLQHNPQIWFMDVIPIDFCFAFYTQTLKVGDLLKSTGTAFGINASKEFSKNNFGFTPYAGFMLESFSMDVNYDYTIDNPDGSTTDENVSFSMEGPNSTRFTIGCALQMTLLNLNIDYNFGKYNSFTAGLMIGF
ncbi:MAG: hypothetical protein GY863_05625 [bacterium]|nr:hypothetical protein [bacterium]